MKSPLPSFFLNPVFTEAEARALNDRVFREVPIEKARAVVRQAEIARILEKCGSISVPGIGQRIGVVDSRTFMRWHQENPGFWNDPSSKRRFLADNPQYRAHGYKSQATPKFFDMGRVAK